MTTGCGKKNKKNEVPKTGIKRKREGENRRENQTTGRGERKGKG